MRININNWKVVNNKLPLFSLFCFLGCLYLGATFNYWYFLLLILVPFTFRKNKLNWMQISIILIICFSFISLIFFAKSFSLIEVIKNNIFYNSNLFVRQKIFQYLDKQFGKEISSFIKLILFNEKTEEIYFFLKQSINLGIVWLICVSGFHISLMSRLIKRIFKKQPRIGRYINISFVAIYSFLLNFNYATIRIFLKICLEPIFRLFQTESFDRLGLIGLLICLLNPICFIKYSFLLSFSICIGANCVGKLNLNNNLIKRILINLTSFLITIPFVIQMNNKLSLFTIINSFLFSYFSSFLFMYFLIFAWIPFMKIIHYGLMIATYVLVGNISFSNIFIYVSPWPEYLKAIYYICIFFISKIIYLIVINNKI